LMSLRAKNGSGDPGVPVFWDFFLNPTVQAIEGDETESDRWRLAVFDEVAGTAPVRELAGRPVAESLRVAMREVADRPKTPTAERLFQRLRGLEPPHRLILLKAAAEWIVARYQHGVDNWTRQRDEWEKEKQEWESRHPELTEPVRNAFTGIFKNLVD